jgi:hypothetical protein
MRYAPSCVGDVHIDACDQRATSRDGVMGIGPEGYAEHYYPSSQRISGWEEANSRESDHKEHTLSDKSISQEQKTLQPEARSAKRTASSPLPHDPKTKKTKIGSDINDDRENYISSGDETGSGSKARTDTPSKPASSTNLSRMTTTTTPSKPADDDSDLEIVDARPSSALKRKLSLSSTPGPAKKRSKQAEIPEMRENADLPRAKHSISNKTTTKDNATTPSKTSRAQVHDLDDEGGESGADASGNESECEEVQETEGLKTARKLIRVNRDFDQACKRCKADANKALKTKHEHETSKLKKEHREELSDVKATAAKTLRDTKAIAANEKSVAKTKSDDTLEVMKKQYLKKIAAMQQKHDTALGTLQVRYSEEQQKNKDLTHQRDEAREKGKKAAEKAAAEVKDARMDLEAGERSLAEQKRQIMREKREEISQLKPEHSKVVKEKDVKIKEMTQKVAQLEKDIKGNERHLYDVQKEAAAEKSRHLNCKTQLTQAKVDIAVADKNLKEAKRFAEKTEHRADTDKVRAKEKIELAVTTRNEQSQRLILQQRENYELKDTVRRLAKLGGEKRDEVERLKAELKSTKAELGVAKDMEGMDDALDQETSATMASPSEGMVFE